MYTNSLVELDVHLSDNLCLFILLMSVWVETRRKNTYEKLLSSSQRVCIYSHSLSRKKQRGGTIHLFIHCQGKFTLVFTPFFTPSFLLFFVSTPTAISMTVRRKKRDRERERERERESEYTYIHIQEHADSPLREQIL